jgi:hypothetical protein
MTFQKAGGIPGRVSLGALAAFAWVGLVSAPLSAAIPAKETGHVLFAFDDTALPFQHGVRMNLISYQSTADGGSVGNLVVPMGPPGAPDSKGLIYYGTVREVNGELWMWYLGLGDHEAKRHYRVCLDRVCRE